MGAIHYYEKERVFKLDTPHTSYLIGIVDEEGFLGHMYYGAKITDYDVRALMRTGEAPFVPSQNNRDRSSFLDAFPMEYPGHGVLRIHVGRFRQEMDTLQRQQYFLYELEPRKVHAHRPGNTIRPESGTTAYHQDGHSYPFPLVCIQLSLFPLLHLDH